MGGTHVKARVKTRLGAGGNKEQTPMGCPTGRLGRDPAVGFPEHGTATHRHPWALRVVHAADTGGADELQANAKGQLCNGKSTGGWIQMKNT